MTNRVHLEHSQDALYEMMKAKAYPLAETITAHTHVTANAKGYKDLWDMVMSDSDDVRQYSFLMTLDTVLSEKQRRILLDGLAKQYQHCEGWLAYVERETSE